MPSILDGSGQIIDAWLGIDERWKGEREPRYCSDTSFQRLCDSANRPEDLNGRRLVVDLVQCIEENWRHAGQPVARGQENWRFEKQLNLTPNNPSPEVTLERSIAMLMDNSWVNQVPVASGVVGDGDQRRAIDLIHQTKGDHYEFIELKVDARSGHVLRAAMEILEYGAIYMFSRKHRERLGYPGDNRLLNAESVELCVLAPREYYGECDLAWLAQAINQGLREATAGRYSMSFQFRHFPEDFTWRPWNVPLANALQGIQPLGQ